jgi:hypothetical protein
MRRLSFFSAMVLVGMVEPSMAWESGGHYRATEAAVLGLPTEVPAFFRWGAGTVAHTAVDPDVMKHRGTPQLRHQEYPEHYIDFELVALRPLPELRYDFVALVARRGLAPDKVGFLPWAVTEGTQRLALAFAQHRCWPEDPHVRATALVYAGRLAHYATDMTQPLHTSKHFDGRVPAGGESPRSGIHQKVDSLFEQPGFAAPGAPSAVAVLDDVWRGVETEFFDSHALVDRVYELEDDLDALYGEGGWSAPLQAFAGERYDRAASFLASLYLTAWQLSGDLEISPWLSRRGPDGVFRTCSAE